MDIQDSLRLCRVALFQGPGLVRLPAPEPGGYGFALLRAGTGCFVRQGCTLLKVTFHQSDGAARTTEEWAALLAESLLAGGGA